MSNDRVKLTREGRDKICKELDVLRGEKRREIAKALSEARSHGDLSENSEYDAAKESQAMNERRISDLEGILMRAQIIENKDVPTDEALLGACVKVKDLKTGEESEYRLVSEEEADFSENKISVGSPVGKALLGHKVGDNVEINVPVGMLVYQILKISR